MNKELNTATYNGWKNRATWNVALWMLNDQDLYRLARESSNYTKYVIELASYGLTATPDGVSYTDDTLDLDALNLVIKEMKS